MMISSVSVELIEIHSESEGHVTLLVNGYVVECFLNSCPYSIEPGKKYNVEFSMDVLEDIKVEKTNRTRVLIEKIPKGYNYYLYGILNDGIFETFTDLDDEDIHYEFPELNHCFIRLEVNRIDVNFL
jgi:hypothetical protein